MTSMPWSARKEGTVHGLSESLRQLDLLNVAWEARVRAGKGKTTVELAADFWCDVSQSSSRRPWFAALKGVRGRGHLYSFEAGRCIDGVESMQVLGWPRSVLLGTPQGDVLHLAEHAAFLPIVTLVEAAMWANPFGDWHTRT